MELRRKLGENRPDACNLFVRRGKHRESEKGKKRDDTWLW